MVFGWMSDALYVESQTDVVNSEFGDLWHSLKVPNDVDLLKQLASGIFSPVGGPGPSETGWYRGSPGYKRGGACTKSACRQKERETRWRTQTAPSAHHQYTHEGRNRPFTRLRGTCEAEVICFPKGEMSWPFSDHVFMSPYIHTPFMASPLGHLNHDYFKATGALSLLVSYLLVLMQTSPEEGL